VEPDAPVEESANLSLTIVVLPYPVTSTKLRDQYLVTFSSWLLTTPRAVLQLLLPRSEFDPDLMILPILETIFGANRIKFSPPVDVDEDNRPYIDDWFLKGLDLAQTDLVCWINADIITPRGWFPRIRYLNGYFHERGEQFAVISRRCDFAFEDEQAQAAFSAIGAGSHGKGGWPPDFDLIAQNRTTHTTWGIDFFLVARDPMQINFDDIPPFHMGKYRWDPWITGWLRAHMPLVTLGDDFCTYHLNHVPKGRQMDDVKVKENFELARRNGNYKVPNGLADFHIRGRYLFKKNADKPIEQIPDWVPEGNAPPETPSDSNAD
jgi:hypothetical protein